MSKVVRYILSAVVVLTLLLGSMAMAPAARSDASIYLKSGVFVPAQSEFAAQGSQKYFMSSNLQGPFSSPGKMR